jgi:hypothetical protein
MQCSCGISWDIDDKTPPECNTISSAKQYGINVCEALISKIGECKPMLIRKGIYQRFDDLQAENAKLRRIIAEAKSISIDLGCTSVNEKLMEAS